MFAAIKVIQGSANRKPLTIDTEEGQTAEPIRQVRIVTDHFNKMFCVENTEALPNIEPAAMEVPFSKEEVQKAVRSLKDGKSAGYDSIKRRAAQAWTRYSVRTHSRYPQSCGSNRRISRSPEERSVHSTAETR